MAYRRIPKERQCVSCDATYVGTSKYCDSPKCKYVGGYLNHPGIDAWVRGETSPFVTKGRHGIMITSWCRAYLKHHAEWKCSRCGWDECHAATGLPPLEVDHIDGDATNNHFNNLRVLCPNCHSLTPTYRRMNAKNKHYS